MSLQAKLDAFKAEFEGGGPPFNVPKPVVDVLHRSIADLVETGAATRARKAGDLAPAFALEDQTGRVVSSTDLGARGPLVVTFYRGAWCPYCNIELEALQAALPAIHDAGGLLVAVSPQTASNSRKVVDDHGFGFPLLSDPGNEVAAAFGLRYDVPDYLVGLMRSLGVDLPAFNGDESWTLPMPARFVVGRAGVIVHAEVNPDYTRRPEPADLVSILRARGAKAA